jgi:hypothetical protein
LDSETDPFKAGRVPRPFIWGAYCLALDRYEQFNTTEQVAEFFSRRKARVYAHNGGKFDYHFLREFINSDEPILVIAGRLAKFKIGDCEFRDSYNILPVPLRAYQKDEVSYDIFESGERDKPANREIIERYLKSDCVYLAEFIDRYFKEYGQNLTQAGGAMKFWARNYNAGTVPKQSAAAFETYRPYYYGGRVECFEVGYKRQNFEVYDINSAYPWAMLFEHPLSASAILMSKLPKDIERCFITLDATARGAFPYRLETGELIFPDDNKMRTYHVTGHEFLAAAELDLLKVTRIRSVHYFTDVVNFRDYITHFYEKRKRAKAELDKAGDLFAKLLMNSLYGKFASDPEKYDQFMIVHPERLRAMAADGWEAYEPWEGGRILVRRPLPCESHRYYNVSCAASITGMVRAKLLRSLAASTRPLYCDTDSIACVDGARLPVSRELGDWKLEMRGDEYAIAGKKLYAFRARETLGEYERGAYKVACKGVKLTAPQIVRVAKGETLRYEPEAPTFSVGRMVPRFISREVKLTGEKQRGTH